MNEVIRQMGKHSSVREFNMSKDVSEELVQVIIKSAMAAPNWINGQQVSVIAVRNSENKKLLAKAAGDQKWVEEAPVFLVFCMDFYRAKIAARKNNKEFRIKDDIEAVIVGSTDVGIALGSAVVAAESLGLGTVPIGGIRKNAEDVIKILDLPEYVYPIAGLAIGYPEVIPSPKPRLPLQATYHKESYVKDKMSELIDQYDETISSYMSERTNGKDTSNWSSKVANFYETRYEPYAEATSPTLKKQGFDYK
ncbi:FMN reductase [NAD(P)H] OS=Ureibacillus acetophenoni OX=614649 GN=SAMN05877842_1076 PE=3 SV=1 [Ureibacillus acetophenoni]|uniref:NADPH-dependent oxidoreductase n=1 Tax=Ureibacillus sp. MALMAid1270 TaxID=3411629 RepID=UPI003BA66972